MSDGRVLLKYVANVIENLVIQEYLHNQKRGKYGSNGEFVEQFVEQNGRVRVRVRVRTVTLI